MRSAREIISSLGNWLERTARWSNLRLLGNSVIVRSTVLLSILGYVILLNRNIADLIEVHVPWISGTWSSSVGWRIFCLYFGTLALALGSAWYTFRCPLTIKRYATAVEFAMAEQSFFWPVEHFRYLIEGLGEDNRNRTPIQKRMPELKELGHRDLMNFRYDPHNHGRARDEDLVVALTFRYHLLDSGEHRSRIAVLILFGLGTALTVAPSIWTALQVIWVSVSAAFAVVPHAAS